MKKLLLLTTVLTTLLTGISAVHADPLDKKSPKIAHGMYREIDKSSPKIAEGMYRDRGKSSPKIAHGMYRDRGKSSPKIAEGMHQGHDNFDDEMRYLLEEFRFARGGR